MGRENYLFYLRDGQLLASRTGWFTVGIKNPWCNWIRGGDGQKYPCTRRVSSPSHLNLQSIADSALLLGSAISWSEFPVSSYAAKLVRGRSSALEAAPRQPECVFGVCVLWNAWVLYRVCAGVVAMQCMCGWSVSKHSKFVTSAVWDSVWLDAFIRKPKQWRVRTT